MTLAFPSSLTDLGRVDRRSRAWRRRARRRAEIVAGLGGEDRLTPHHKELVNLLLGLGQLVEGFQAKMAEGHEIDAERYLSAVKEQRRVILELGLRRGQPSKPSLSEHLIQKAAERAGGRS